MLKLPGLEYDSGRCYLGPEDDSGSAAIGRLDPRRQLHALQEVRPIARARIWANFLKGLPDFHVL